MSPKSAKTHTQVSNREKSQRKGKDRETKEVFKSVLDNPFRIRWPSVPVNMQNLILAQLVSLLEDVTKYNQQRDEANRKRKRTAHVEQVQRKKQKQTPAADASNTNQMSVDQPLPDADPIVLDAPILLQHLVVGINAVTKRLESQIQSARHRVTVSNQPPDELPLTPPLIKYVFVCRTDIDPPILIDHFPLLVASYNTSNPSSIVKLVPLPKGAELTLAACLNVRRVAAFAFDADATDLITLPSLLESVPSLAASWLAPAPTMIPTHIKQVRTTAPKDLKSAKEDRTAGRAESKKSKKRKREAEKSNTTE